MNTLAALILAVVTALSAGSVPEPEHDPATRAQDMAEAPTGAPESDGSAAHAQTHTEEPTSPHEAFLTPLASEYVAYCVDVCEGYGLDPAVVFGVPVRYIPSHNGILDDRDLEACIELTCALIRNMSK